MDTFALATGLFGLLVTAVYLFLGTRLAYRDVAPVLRLPSGQFATFWLCLAGISVVGAALSLDAAFTSPSLALVVTMVHLEILLLCAALWGLLGFLTYLYTGKSHVALWSLFYAGLYVTLSFLITASRPNMVSIRNGIVGVQYAQSFAGLLFDVLVVGLLAPEFIAAFLYFTLVFRTSDRTVRYRVTLTSWSLITVFALAVVTPTIEPPGLAGALIGQSFGAIAALVILLAYYPPRAFRARFGVRGIDPSTPAPVPGTQRRLLDP